MPDEPDLPVPFSPSETFLGHVAHLPAMFSAISRLVGKTADIGTAWLDIPVAEGERRAQAIRDDKVARTAMVKLIQEAAGGKAITDPALLERAIDAWAGERLRKQTNKEEVAKKAVDDAEANPPPKDAKPPSDDWMNLFEGLAERASSEAMRSLFGKVLSGEIRQSGSFSFQALQFFSILDPQLAKTIEKVSGCVVARAVIPHAGSYGKGSGYTDLVTLSTCGVVQLGSAQYYSLNEQGMLHLPFFKDCMVLIKGTPNLEIQISGAIITSLGHQIFKMIDSAPDTEFAGQFAQDLRTRYGFEANVLNVQFNTTG